MNRPALRLVAMPVALHTLLLEEIPRRHRGVLAWRLRTALANADLAAARQASPESPDGSADAARVDHLRADLLNLIAELEGGHRPRGEVPR